MSPTLAPSTIRSSFLLLAALALTLGSVPRAGAQQHLVRRYGVEQGLPVPPVWALAQDGDGFLWLGGQTGLYRYDGIKFRRWAPELIAGPVAGLTSSPDGRVAAQLESGATLLVTSSGTTRLAPPSGGGLGQSSSIAFDHEGRLWMVDAGGALVYHADDDWHTISRERMGGERVRRVRGAARGGVYILTESGLWYIANPGSEPEKRYDKRLADVVSLSDGRLLLLTVYGDVVEVDSNESRLLASKRTGEMPTGRPIALAVRGDVIWVALDRYLVALRPTSEPEWIGPEDGLESGGALLVDREGSLWMGTFTSLLQYPEPETALWTHREGLPGLHTRYVARSENALWVTSWQGTTLVRRTKKGIVARHIPQLGSQSRPCADSSGAIWLSSSTVARLHGDSVVGRLGPRSPFNGCALSPGGVLWIATDNGLLRAHVAGGKLRSIDGLPFEDRAPIETVYRDRGDYLWITSRDRACRAPVVEIESGRGTRWKCETVPGARFVAALVEVDGDVLWAATRGAGIVARDADGWRRVPASAALPSSEVFVMKPSPSGGIWIAGHGTLLRVQPGGADGWKVLETPGVRHGLPTVGGSDLLEDSDGTLWITTALGLLQVRPQARFAPDPAPPRVVVVDARADTVTLPRDEIAQLGAERNRLELRFAALTFRDPGSVRYQVRLAADAPWSDSRGQPSVRWADIPPGRYQAEVRASLDGVHWSARPAHFDFRVLPPWYRTPWAFALFTVLAGAIVWALYRARLAFHLGLERQRTRIAMDLHDELGSGLGSIGILAGVLGGGRLDDAHRGRVAREVAETAEELGSALSDIVWSLDPRTATFEEVAGRLASHAERFFAGGEVEFTLRAPRAWPAEHLPLTLRRNLLLIGVEAIHNAARHACPRRVTLAFAMRGTRCEMSVADDGVGFRDGVPREPRRGHGVRGMRRRAEEIDASLDWRETAGGGTTVVLRFGLRGSVRRRVRALRKLRMLRGLPDLRERSRRRPPMA